MPFSKTTFMHIDYFQSKHFWQQKLTVFSNIGLKNVFYQFKRFLKWNTPRFSTRNFFKTPRLSFEFRWNQHSAFSIHYSLSNKFTSWLVDSGLKHKGKAGLLNGFEPRPLTLYPNAQLELLLFHSTKVFYINTNIFCTNFCLALTSLTSH